MNNASLIILTFISIMLFIISILIIKLCDVVELMKTNNILIQDLVKLINKYTEFKFAYYKNVSKANEKNIKTLNNIVNDYFKNKNTIIKVIKDINNKLNNITVLKLDTNNDSNKPGAKDSSVTTLLNEQKPSSKKPKK